MLGSCRVRGLGRTMTPLVFIKQYVQIERKTKKTQKRKRKIARENDERITYIDIDL